MASQEIVDGGLELWAPLADRPSDVAAGTHSNPIMYRDVGEDLLPEVCLVLVDDNERYQPSVYHLDQILVLQRLRRFFDAHDRPVLRGKALVERHQAFVIA